ncbi:MAG: hypothetical protein F4025_00115 [Synechococcus sp. SB0669_bin_7]|nr:hypothetical protein [Synechococcus sp. SB0675_bin_7]MYK84831.1 hypothetical protein [Synechococcus sp. SB0669_bin_7]
MATGLWMMCPWMEQGVIPSFLPCRLSVMRSLIPSLRSIAKTLRTSDSPPAARWAWLLGIVLAVGLLLQLIRISLSHGPYDHDIDSFLYMAWRLLEGNLLFIDHYDSKLPIVQYLYIPSFLSGSIFGHRLVTFAVATATALLFYRCLLSLKRLGLLSKQTSRTWMVLCSTLLLCFGQTHPGGLSGHLHLFANGFLVLALRLLLKSLMANPEQPQRVVIWQLLGGGSLAWAIQTRPNLLVSVGFCGLIWLIARGLQRRLGWRESGAVCSLAIGAVLLSLPFILPYLLHPDGLNLLKIGGWDLLHQWNSEGHGVRSRLGLLGLLKAMYWDQAFVDFNPYGLPLLPIPILLLFNLRGVSIHPRGWVATTWIPLLSSSFITGLWFSFLKTHFWPHYLLLETVPITLLFAWIPTGLAQNRVPQVLRIGFTWIGIIVGSFIILNLTVVETIRLLFPSERSAIAKTQELLVQRLRSLPPGQHFFAPGDPSFHWKLQESMPVKGIHRAWILFKSTTFLNPSTATRRMGIATSPTERCDQLLAKPTDIIIWVESKAPLNILQSCFATSEDDWQDLTEEYGVKGSGYHVFRRRS